uniref:Uncharacterized protein n=1 Tax=Anguilla anguilla TaxID=7936 RepID=A0A0E9SYU4_ANGAN
MLNVRDVKYQISHVVGAKCIQNTYTIIIVRNQQRTH